MRVIYKQLGKWRSNWSELCIPIFQWVKFFLLEMSDPACQTHQECFFPSLSLTFLEKRKKLPRNPKATWLGTVRKTYLQNPSDLKHFCPCVYRWNHCITLPYRTMPLSPKSGNAALCRCLWAAHSVNFWSYFLLFSVTLGWDPPLFLIYSTHDWVLFTTLYLCRWLSLFKHEICSYWIFLPFLFRSVPRLKIILIF